MANWYQMTVGDVYEIVSKLNDSALDKGIYIEAIRFDNDGEDVYDAYSDLKFRTIPFLISKCNVLKWDFNVNDDIVIYINDNDEWLNRWKNR